MRYVIAWEHPGTGRVSLAQVSFAVKELAEDAARTLGRLRPEREYWVEGEDEAPATEIAAATQRRGAVEEIGAASASNPDSSSQAGRPAPKPPVSRQADLGWLALPAVRPDRLVGDRQN